MSVDINRYSRQIRRLCEDYYCHNLDYIEYKQLRNDLFAQLEGDLRKGYSSQDDSKEYLTADLLEDVHASS